MNNLRDQIRNNRDDRTKGPRVSFEFFPPSGAQNESGLWQTVRKLEPMTPSFVSVTYGAGGSTREGTLRTVGRIVSETSLDAAAHLTCVGATRGEVDSVIEEMGQTGIGHIVALRGDAPENSDCYRPHPDGYANAAELVEGIKRIGNFEVSVAAYPEKHPDSPSIEADLAMLQAKVDAGATRAITQFFFSNDAYFRYVDKVRARGITIPIVPGLLPITNLNKAKTFAERCGATVPQSFVSRFAGLEEDPQARMLVAAAVAAEQVTSLVEQGVDAFHLYTLNRSELAFAICRLLGLGVSKIPQAA